MTGALLSRPPWGTSRSNQVNSKSDRRRTKFTRRHRHVLNIRAARQTAGGNYPLRKATNNSSQQLVDTPVSSIATAVVSRGAGTPTNRGESCNNKVTFDSLQLSNFIKLVAGDLVARRRGWCSAAHLHKRDARFRCRRRVLSKLHYRAAVCTGYIVTAGCICRGALCPVRGQSNGLIALSTQLRNCLQFTISLSSAPRSLRPRWSILWMTGRREPRHLFSL